MEIFMQLGAIVLNALLALLHPILRFIYRKKLPVVPPAKNALLKMPAVMLAKKIREREITCQSVVQAYVERVKEANNFVNALVEDRFEAALKDAKSCDEKLEKGELSPKVLEKEQPLYGVPFTVKESCALKGLSHTGGSVARQGIKAHTDADAVRMLKKAGGIPLCVTNTPELCVGFDAHNFLFGRTNNAYDGRRIAGGSSGGEGALLGAGASVLGIGSDIAGSVRVPAFFNGIFGHKPTAGVVPIDGHFPMSDDPKFRQYLLLGPMTRYAEDLHLAMRILSQKSPVDLRLDDPVDTTKLKVFYLEDVGRRIDLIPTSTEIRLCIREVAEHFSARGLEVKQLPFDMIDSADIGAAMIFGLNDTPQILIDPDNPKHEKSAICELFKSIFGLSRYTGSAIFLRLLQELNGLVLPCRMSKYQTASEELRQKFIDLLGNDGVFLYPTFPHVAPLPHVIDFELTAVIYCVLWNVLGFPATNVPMGLNRDGLPIGIQVIAAPYQDRLCLAVAKELEKAFGGWKPPVTSSLT